VAQADNQFSTIHAGHEQVRNNDIVRTLGDSMQSLDAVFRTITMKSLLLQGKLNHLSRNTFIVHNQSPMW